MLFNTLLWTFSQVASLATATPLKRDFGPVDIYVPPSGTPTPSNYTDPKTNYGRGLLLEGSGIPGVLLSTFEDIYEDGAENRPYLPIYRSTDYGGSWTRYSQVEDQVNGWGLRYQPHMIQLTGTVGNYGPGTILLAGNSVPPDLSATKLDIYASTDLGLTWEFVTSVAQGGGYCQQNCPSGGPKTTPVWEPFLLEYEGQIVCFYSDERDPNYSQKLVHQVSPDLVNWGPIVPDVLGSDSGQRPGMTTVAQVANGRWIMTYEYLGAPEGVFAVYYKMTDSPLEFNNIYGFPVTANGYTPTSSPFVLYTPVGGDNGLGTIVVSAYSSSDMFVSRDQGASWQTVPTWSGNSYSRGMVVAPKPKDILIFAGNQGSNSAITMTATDVNGCTYCS